MFPENKYQEERVVSSKLTQTANEMFPSNCTAAPDAIRLPPTPRPSEGMCKFTNTLSPLPLHIPGSVVDLDELWEDPFQIYEERSVRNNDGYCWIRPYNSGPLTPEPLPPYDKLPKCRCGLYSNGDRQLWLQSQMSYPKAQSRHHRHSNHSQFSRQKASKKNIPETVTSLYGRIIKKSKKIYENFLEFLGMGVNKRNHFSDGHAKKRKHRDWVKQSYGHNTSWI